MKTSLTLCLGLFALVPLPAQVLRPEAVNGALLGGVAGAVIGNNSGSLNHNAWKGAAIGAAAGLIAGDMAGRANAGPAHLGVSGAYVYRDSPVVYAGYRSGYSGGHAYRGGHGYPAVVRHHGYYPRSSYGVSFGYYPGYDYGYYPYGGYYGSGSAAVDGLWLGALAGGIIGHNSGEFRHNGWRGAAWGAGAGWLLGTVIDANRRPVVYQAPAVTVPVASAPAVAAPAAAPAAAPQNVTIINNYYNGSAPPMSQANSLFGRN